MKSSLNPQAPAVQPRLPRAAGQAVAHRVGLPPPHQAFSVARGRTQCHTAAPSAVVSLSSGGATALLDEEEVASTSCGMQGEVGVAWMPLGSCGLQGEVGGLGCPWGLVEVGWRKAEHEHLGMWIGTA